MIISWNFLLKLVGQQKHIFFGILITVFIKITYYVYLDVYIIMSEFYHSCQLFKVDLVFVKLDKWILSALSVKITVCHNSREWAYTISTAVQSNGTSPTAKFCLGASPIWQRPLDWMTSPKKQACQFSRQNSSPVIFRFFRTAGRRKNRLSACRWKNGKK